MTNAERLSKNPKELAHLFENSLSFVGCSACPCKSYCHRVSHSESMTCSDIIEEWLLLECENTGEKSDAT